jgi:hypothetical protein
MKQVMATQIEQKQIQVKEYLPYSFLALPEARNIRGIEHLLHISSLHLIFLLIF